MFSNTLKKALVVAAVALTVPVLSAGSAYADNDKANGKDKKEAAAPATASEHGKGKGNDEVATTTTTAPAEHGKGNETDPSGSSTNPDGTFQGKSSSTPDQDGKGMDRGAANNDKTGPGTDGNNGCGNEPRLAAPRDGGRPTDDDNNGWCGAKPKPVHPAPVKVENRPEAPKKSTTPAAPAKVTPAEKTQPVVVQAPVSAPVTAPVAAPVAAPAVVANGNVSPLQGVVAQAASASPAFVGPTVTPRVTQGAVVAAAAAAPAALPFTGAPVGLLLLVAGLVIGAGALLTYAGSRTA